MKHCIRTRKSIFRWLAKSLVWDGAAWPPRGPLGSDLPPVFRPTTEAENPSTLTLEAIPGAEQRIAEH